MKRPVFNFGIAIAFMVMTGLNPCHAQPTPPPLKAFAIDMYCSCDDGTQLGEMITGHGATCWAAEQDAISKLNCSQHSGMCEEGDVPVPTIESDCYPDEGEILMSPSGQVIRRRAPVVRPWHVRLKYTYCDGYTLAIIGKGCTYQQAYRSAKRRHCLRAAQHGGINWCAGSIRVLKKPCCCQPCRPRRGLFGILR